MAAHKIPIGARLLSYWKIRGSCWVWTGARDKDGYGVIKIAGKSVRLTRFIFKEINGRIPKDHDICHKCDNPPCFRPSHLFNATNAENQKDKVAKGRQAKGDRHGRRTHPESIRTWRKTHCPHGVPAPALDCDLCETARIKKREVHSAWRKRQVHASGFQRTKGS